MIPSIAPNIDPISHPCRVGAALKVGNSKSGFNLTSQERAIYLDYGIYLMHKGRWDIYIYTHDIYIYIYMYI